MIQKRVKISDDSAFWSRLSIAIAQAADFDTALDQAMAHCAERTGATLCFLAVFYPTHRMVEHVKLHIAPDSNFAGLNIPLVPPMSGRHAQFRNSALEGADDGYRPGVESRRCFRS